MFESVLIANRGEIARRVIQTLDRLGIRSVAIFAADDRHAPHVREADEAVSVPSYLDLDAIIAACTQTQRAGAAPRLRLPVGEPGAREGVRVRGRRVRRTAARGERADR